MSDLPPPPAPAADPARLAEMDMNTFLVSSAHDMKNSVGVMSAYLESALAELPADSSSRYMTCQALYEAQRLNHHLIQLLAIYKINNNMYPFDPVDIDLRAFEQEVTGRVRPLAEAKGIVLEVVGEPAEHSWYFDYELVASLVTQALHNAVKYTRDRVRLSLRVVDGQLEIRVDDNGGGFPQFLIEAGYAASQGIDADSGSTGLGLFFAARVAQLHRNRASHGSTRLANDGLLGGGAFILSLP